MTQAQRKKSYRFGIMAEYAAAAYLMGKGYRILAMRYRNGGGEIDIVARRGRTLIIVEVKARRTLVQCTEAIAPWKQQKIARAAEGLLAGHGKIAGLRERRDLNIRFDAVWVIPWRLPLHIQDAWRL